MGLDPEGAEGFAQRARDLRSACPRHDLGGIAIAGSPADFGKLIADETEKWGKVVRAANIKAD